MEEFEPFIGEWATEGTHGLIPGTVLKGYTNFKVVQGLVVMTSAIVQDVGIPNGTAVFGKDDILNTYSMVYSDVRGIHRIYRADVSDNVLTWWRDENNFWQEYSLTAQGDTLIGKGMLSEDNGFSWQPDLSLTYTRISK